jgi:hypothetical protein
MCASRLSLTDAEEAAYARAKLYMKSARAAQRLADKTNPSLNASKVKRGVHHIKAHPTNTVARRKHHTLYIIHFDRPVYSGRILGDCFGPFETIPDALIWIDELCQFNGAVPEYRILMMLDSH